MLQSNAMPPFLCSLHTPSNSFINLMGFLIGFLLLNYHLALPLKWVTQTYQVVFSLWVEVLVSPFFMSVKRSNIKERYTLYFAYCNGTNSHIGNHVEFWTCDLILAKLFWNYWVVCHRNLIGLFTTLNLFVKFLC